MVVNPGGYSALEPKGPLITSITIAGLAGEFGGFLAGISAWFPRTMRVTVV
jgi:hypothetical protein